MFNIDVLTLFAFFGTFQGLIFAVIFWTRNKVVANKVFALLLLATSIRIAKNIFVHLHELNPEMFENLVLWRASVYIGLSHQFAIGPLFLIYFWSKIDSKFKLRPVHFLHFIPYGIFVVVSPFVTWSFWRYGGLWCSYVSILVYFLLTVWYFFKGSESLDAGNRKWMTSILIVTAVLLFAYSPALFHYIGYVGGAALYAIGVFFVGYVISGSKNTLPFQKSKYDSSSITKAQLKEIKERLSELMSNEKPYLNPELTLNTLSGILNVKPHHLSRVINQELNSSFSDYINEFRIKASIQMLEDPKNDHLKMSAIAYSCGFNSVPTFNTLFKKIYNTTPSAYRKSFRRS